MNSSCWRRVLGGHTTRRRLLAATSASAAGATLLVACGGGATDEQVVARIKVFSSDKEEGPARRGGTWQTAIVGDPPSLDPYRTQSIVTQSSVGAYVYSRLMKYQTGPGSSPSLPRSKGDLAESYEVSPDGATYTFKLRQGFKFLAIANDTGTFTRAVQQRLARARQALQATGSVTG